MKRIALWLAILCTLLSGSEVFAYKSFGIINDYVKYRNFGITVGFSPRVCFELLNDTKKHVRISTDVTFSDRSGFVDKATIETELKKKSKKRVCSYLDERDYRGVRKALYMEWDVYMLEVDDKKIFSREPKYEKQQ